MDSKWLKWSAFHGFSAVALGAFAAHALKARLDEGSLRLVETAARYQMFHALALLGLASLEGRLPAAKLRFSATAMAWGTLVFSGSLDALAFTGMGWLGALTPLGGLGMLAGWAALFFL